MKTTQENRMDPGEKTLKPIAGFLRSDECRYQWNRLSAERYNHDAVLKFICDHMKYEEGQHSMWIRLDGKLAALSFEYDRANGVEGIEIRVRRGV